MNQPPPLPKQLTPAGIKHRKMLETADISRAEPLPLSILAFVTLGFSFFYWSASTVKRIDRKSSIKAVLPSILLLSGIGSLAMGHSIAQSSDSLWMDGYFMIGAPFMLTGLGFMVFSVIRILVAIFTCESRLEHCLKHLNSRHSTFATLLVTSTIISPGFLLLAFSWLEVLAIVALHFALAQYLLASDCRRLHDLWQESQNSEGQEH